MAQKDQAYLLLGPEIGEKKERLEAIISALRKRYNNQVEVTKFFPFDTQQGEIFTVLQNNSLFADYQVVILERTDECNVQQMNDLAEYLKNPNPQATLILMSDQTYLNQKVSSQVPKNNSIIFWEMFENRKADWVRNYFRQAGFAIEQEAITLLLELVQNNTEALRINAEQLIQFFADDKSLITEEKIELYIHHTRHENPFTLFEALGGDSFARSLEILAQLSDYDHVSLLALLLWQFRRLLSYLQLVSRGVPHEQACLEATVAGKPTPIRRKKDQALMAFLRQRYPLENLPGIIVALGECDIALREAPTMLHQLILERLMYQIQVLRGKALHQVDFPSLLRDAKF